MSPPTVFLAAESLDPGKGGICRVARLMARVLDDEAAAGRLQASGLVLSDLRPPPDLHLPVRPVRGRRASFVARVASASWFHSHFLYDSLGMARAHGRVPLLRRPALAYIHGIEVWPGTAANRIAAARRATVLVSNTTFTRERAAQLDPVFSRARVCWLATEEDEPPPPAPRPEGPPTVLIVGRMDEALYKGHRELIACWPAVRSAVREARLTIVGGGPAAPEVRALAAASPAAAAIEFTGFLSEAALQARIHAASLLAMPSRFEGFGLVYIEAMRHGVPVVASVHDAAPEVNIHGETGLNVNLDREGELAEALVSLLRDRHRSAAMGEAGRRRWHTHFRYSAFRERFRPILADFLAGRV